MNIPAPAVDALRVERTFNAPAQAVFDAWTNPEVIKRWLHAAPDWGTPFAESDLWVGGRVGATMRETDGTEHGWTGEYTEVDPPSRLAFTFLWHTGDDDRDGLMLIELDFTEQDGATTLVLTQTGFATEESRESHEGGWNACFDNLENKALPR